MDSKIFRDAILQQIGFPPTPGQSNLVEKLADFVSNRIQARLFVIKGYAGTGKTTVLSSLVKALSKLKYEFVLLAPTGRAAKVLAGYSGYKAYTIHKKIYWLAPAADGQVNLRLQINKHCNTLFIVDEASMLATKPSEQGDVFAKRNLLDDLMEFVLNGRNCKMIFTGDTAQLPPVFDLESLALSKEFLAERYFLETTGCELTDVVRQALQSGILLNATALRTLLTNKSPAFPSFQCNGFKDFVRLAGSDVADAINTAFMSSFPEDSLIVCRSNKRANLYNQFIRSRVLFREEELSAGDLLMVVKNNYFWLPENSNAGFIANGDIVQIKRVRKLENEYGFRFADITVRLLDYPDEPDLDLKIIINTIGSESSALAWNDSKVLYEAVALDYAHVMQKKERIRLMRENPYLNALQVKFAYALTCHKAQGGQWENVFVDLVIASDTIPDEGTIRWLYTAITRATHRVYLLNFADSYFDGNGT